MQLSTTITSKGQIVIPKPIRDQLGLQPFDQVTFSVKNSQIVLVAVDSTDKMRGFIKTKKEYSEDDFATAVNNAVIQKHRPSK